MSTEESIKPEQNQEVSIFEPSIDQSAISLHQQSINTEMNQSQMEVGNMSIDHTNINVTQIESSQPSLSSVVDNSTQLLISFINVNAQQQSVDEQGQFLRYLEDVKQEIKIEKYLQQRCNLSGIGFKQRKKMMDHVEKYIDLLTVEYPQELAFLKQTLNNNLLLIVQRFKRIFPLKQKHKHRANQKLPVQVQERYYKNYWQYDLQDSEPGVYSKYLKLDLSYRVNIDVNSFIQCGWKNLSQLNLIYCDIGNQGWDYLMSVIPTYAQLRKLNLKLNLISEVSQSDLLRFQMLPHFMQINIRLNPLTKWSLIYLGRVQKVVKEKFQILSSGLNYPVEKINVKSFLKLQREELKQMQRIGWAHQGLSCPQWDLIVDNFRLFQSIRTIDFSHNTIKTITLKQLQKINSFVEKRMQNTKMLEKGLTIMLYQNPLTQKSIDAIRQFYKKYRWSKVSIQNEQFTAEYHNDRLRNSLVKDRIFSLHFSIIKNLLNDYDMGDPVDDLIEQIENVLNINPLNELREQNYLKEIFEYVMLELGRVQGANKVGKFNEKFTVIRDKFFYQYENIEKFEENNMMNINEGEDVE